MIIHVNEQTGMPFWDPMKGENF